MKNKIRKIGFMLVLLLSTNMFLASFALAYVSLNALPFVGYAMTVGSLVLSLNYAMVMSLLTFKCISSYFLKHSFSWQMPSHPFQSWHAFSLWLVNTAFAIGIAVYFLMPFFNLSICVAIAITTTVILRMSQFTTESIPRSIYRMIVLMTSIFMMLEYQENLLFCLHGHFVFSWLVAIVAAGLFLGVAIERGDKFMANHLRGLSKSISWQQLPKILIGVLATTVFSLLLSVLFFPGWLPNTALYILLGSIVLPTTYILIRHYRHCRQSGQSVLGAMSASLDSFISHVALAAHCLSESSLAAHAAKQGGATHMVVFFIALGQIIVELFMDGSAMINRSPNSQHLIKFTSKNDRSEIKFEEWYNQKKFKVIQLKQNQMHQLKAQLKNKDQFFYLTQEEFNQIFTYADESHHSHGVHIVTKLLSLLYDFGQKIGCLIHIAPKKPVEPKPTTCHQKTEQFFKYLGVIAALTMGLVGGVQCAATIQISSALIFIFSIGSCLTEGAFLGDQVGKCIKKYCFHAWHISKEFSGFQSTIDATPTEAFDQAVAAYQVRKTDRLQVENFAAQNAKPITKRNNLCPA